MVLIYQTVQRYSQKFVILTLTAVRGGMPWRSWLRHCATSRRVAGSIPDGVIGIFHWHDPSGPNMALGSTQPLIEMSTRNISWGVKSAGALSWQPYNLHVPIVLKSRNLNLLEPSGPLQACNGIALPLQPSKPQIPHRLCNQCLFHPYCKIPEAIQSKRHSTAKPEGRVVLYLNHKSQLHTYWSQKGLLKRILWGNHAPVSYEDGETVTTPALTPHKAHVAVELHD